MWVYLSIKFYSSYFLFIFYLLFEMFLNIILQSFLISKSSFVFFIACSSCFMDGVSAFTTFRTLGFLKSFQLLVLSLIFLIIFFFFSFFLASIFNVSSIPEISIILESGIKMLKLWWVKIYDSTRYLEPGHLVGGSQM